MVPNASGPRAIDGPWSLRAPGRARPVRKGKAGVRGSVSDRGETERGWSKTPRGPDREEPEKGKEGEREEGAGQIPRVEGGYR